MARALGRDADARRQAVDLLRAASDAIRNPDRPVAPVQVAAAGKVLERVAATGPRTAQVDVRRLQKLLPALAGLTPNQIVRLLGEHGPEDGVPAEAATPPVAAGLTSGR